MPEIKIKHVVSFSSEDKVHKAENLIQPETYRQWKCATPGEKSATIVLQFEKATQINSIDIGNAGSAFVEVLVGRSSDTVSDYKVLLVASSFMSPVESRCGTHLNRVRMFGPEKLSQSTKDEKWDCVQVVCTQPFNSRTTYGLSFVKFHSPGEKVEEQSKSSESDIAVTRIGAFKLRNEDEDENDSLLTAGSWFEKKKTQLSQSSSSSTVSKTEPSYASIILASASDANKMSSQNNAQKRKVHETKESSDEPAVKKAFYAATARNKGVNFNDVSSDEPERKKVPETNSALKKITNEIERKRAFLNTSSAKKEASVAKASEDKKAPQTAPLNSTSAAKAAEKVPFGKILDKVVFVLSGFVNPLRSTIRDKALEMGAKYKGDWDRSCTHLICAFINTPKYQQVKQLNGKIVAKEWILDSYKKKKPLPWTEYMLEKPSQDSSSSEENEYSEEEIDDSDEDPDYSDEEEYTDKKKKRKKRQNNKAKKIKNTPATPNKRKHATAGKNDLSASSEEDQPNIPTKKAKSKPKTPTKNNQACAVTKDVSASSEEDRLNIPSKNILSANNNQNHSDVSAKRDSPSTSNLKILSDSSQSPTLLLQIKDESATEDEEALQDYLADTDPEADSGGNTEDEIRKFEEEVQKNGGSPSKKVSEEDSGYSEKPDVSDLPLPNLPNLFKQKHFLLYGNFTSSKRHDLKRYIIANNGVVEDYMSNNIKYVITESKWGKEFDEAFDENEDLLFVKPAWIYKCHDAGKLVPYQPFIIIPDS